MTTNRIFPELALTTLCGAPDWFGFSWIGPTAGLLLSAGVLLSTISSSVAQVTLPPVSGYSAWLRADQGIVLDANNKVSQWQDQSGNGYHFAQTSPDKCPILVATAIGDQPAVRFDGEDDGLWGVETMNIGRPSTVFVVYERLRHPSGNGNYNSGYVLENSTGAQWFVHSDGFFSGNNWVRNTGTGLDEEVVAVMTNSATSTRVHVNGSDWTQDATQTTGTPGRLALGGGNGRNYDPAYSLVSEVIVYDRALSDAERQEVEAYLAGRYALYDTRVATPAIDPPSQLVSGNTIVSMSVSTSGAEIRYTLDGSEPTAGSPLYSTALNVAPGATVKARGVKSGWLPSAVAETVYTASATVPMGTNGLQMWLRADRGVTVNEAGAVERWEDLSGHGNHVLQTTSFQQPIFQLAAFGNQPAIRFDGENDGLWGVQTMNIGRPSTVFVVYERLRHPSGNGNYNSGYVLENSTGAQWFVHSDGFFSGNNWVRNTGTGLDEEVVAVMTNSATSTRVHVNGSDWTHDASQTTGTPGRLALGGGNGRNYDPAYSLVSEVIVYDRTLSDGERQEVEAYLAGRYALYDTRVATPAIDPPSQLVSGNTIVSMSVSTSGAEIRYTLDGSEPTAGSPLYSAAFNVTPGAAVKARAFKTGLLDSYVAQTVYTASTTAPMASSGLQMWLRADQGVTVNEAGAVERWEDLSGHGNHLVQTTTFQQPVLQSAVLGNQAAIRFDGENDGLWGVQTMNIGRPSTVFVVYERLRHPSGNGNYNSGYVLENSTGAQWFVHSDGFFSGNNWVRNTGTGLDEEVVAVMTNSATSTRVHVNGSDWTHDASQTTGTPGRLALGGGNGRNYDPAYSLVSEVIVYDRTLSDGERQEVEAYLAGRYALYDTRVATPAIDPPSQLASANTSVSISVSTSGAEIRYTLDGSEPTAGSPLYSTALNVAPGATVKARGFKSGWLPSAVAETVYTASATVPMGTNGLQMWLRADRGVTVNEAGAVERWDDLSGHGNHVLQSTSFQQPMLQPAALGNQPAIRFDGENDGLWGVETMNIGRPSTVFVVYERLRHPSGNGNYNSGYVLENSTGAQWFVHSDGFFSGNNWVRNTGTSLNQEVVAVMTNSATSTRVHVNGSDWTHDASQTTGTPGRLALGGGNGRNYDPAYSLVSEVIVYDRVLNNAERQSVENYITTRYAFTEARAALPVASAHSGTFFGAVDTTLSTSTPGAIIRFTTDGNDPIATSPTYSSTLRFFTDTTLKARAFAADMNPSSVLEERYIVRQGLNAPSFWSSAAGGNGHYYRLAYYSYPVTWDQAQAEAQAMGGYLATLTSGEENAFVFETVARDPHAWNFEEGPFLGGFQSTGSAEPGGGWQWGNGEGQFNFTAWQPGEPNNSGNENVLHYRSHAPAWNDRANSTQAGVRSFIVEFNDDPEFNIVSVPAASPPVGTYDGDVAVRLESPTVGAIIRYTIDGQTPAESSAIYQGPITLNVTTTIRARAYKSGMYPSQLISFHYNIIPTLKPDLTIQNLEMAEANPQSGSSVTLKWKEANSGNAPADGTFYDSVRVRNAGSGETLLDSIISPDPASSLAIGESRDRQHTLKLPDGPRSVGTLEFIVTADFLNAIYEGTPGGVAETNNAASISADATLADYPDLKVTSIAPPASGLLEQRVQLSWTVKNDGPGATTGSWRDQIYLSDDAALGNDQALGSFLYTSPLAPGASVTRTELITLPPTGTGARYLIVVTNSTHEVFELSGDNNALVSSQPTEIGTYAVSVDVAADTALGGTAITLNGTTFDPVTGALVGNAAVTIRITHNGTVRLIFVISDATGHYQVTFTPLPGEAGDYEVAADRPSVVGNVTQDQFSLIAMSVTPGEMEHRLLPGTAQTGQVDLRNLGTRPLTGIQATVTDAATNVVIQVNPPSQLAPSASAPVTYTITATNDSIFTNPGTQIRFVSAEGAVATLPLKIEVASQAPRLVATPGTLNAGMLRGSQKVVEFEISNTGATATGELNVALPQAPWLALATPPHLPSLASGQKATVALTLTPATNLALGPYTGTLVISGAATSLTIPFQFTAVSNLVGDVHITAVDEFTFFAEGAPKVSGAVVTLTDPATGEVVRTGATASNGELLFTGVREGNYYIESRAPEHNSHRSNLLVTASQTTEVSAFLARELISYTWIVTPTEIEDHYIFTLEVKFVTDVPAPVVVVEPASIDLSKLTQDTTQINFTVTNHGLIAAEHVNLSFEDDPVWKITPLLGNIGTLAAKQSVVIPVTFQHLRQAAQAQAGSVRNGTLDDPAPQGKCQISGSVGSDFQCGGSTQFRSAPITAHNAGKECGSPSVGGTVPLPGVVGPSTSNSKERDCSIEILRDEAGGEVQYEKIEDGLAKALPGQQINLFLRVPEGQTATDIQWIVPGAVFRNFYIDEIEGIGKLIHLQEADFSRNRITFYWADAGTKHVKIRYKLSGEQKEATATLDLATPSSSLEATIEPAGLYYQLKGDTMFVYIGLGIQGVVGGITYTAAVAIPPEFERGSWCFAQLVTPRRYRKFGNGPLEGMALNNSRSLDGAFPYRNRGLFTTGNSGSDGDHPAMIVYEDSPSLFTQFRTFDDSSFQTFVMFLPPGDRSQWVALKKLSWSYSISSYKVTDQPLTDDPILLSYPPTEHVSSSTPTNTPPEWSTTVGTNNSWIPLKP